MLFVKFACWVLSAAVVAARPQVGEASCVKYEVIVARGTSEPGKFGTIVGDPLVKGVTAKLPGSRGYAVNYPADNNWNVGVPKGVNDIIKRVNTLSEACPDIKFAMVGYSLGAAVMHSTFSRTNTTNGPIFNKELYPKIVALVMFGDPGLVIRQRQGPNDSRAFPPELFAKLRQNCAANDSTCDPRGTSFQPHLTYGQAKWMPPSVDFIVAAFKGEPLPKAPRTAEELGLSSGGKGAPRGGEAKGGRI